MENKFKLKLGSKDLSIEVNTLAEQANGSVIVRYGDTVVLGTAVMSKQEREGIDFFPLYVDFEEKFYAAGKILGARYIRREGRPTDEAILTARLIDRAIRPLFPDGLKKEVQVIITCLSWDKENDPDILGLIAASCALSLSDIPWNGPVAGLRIGRRKEKFILNPTYAERGNLLNLSEELNQSSKSEQSDLDFVLTGIESENQKSRDILINMIEAECAEAREDTILNAVKFANPELKKIIDFQKEIAKKTGKEKIVLAKPAPEPELEREIKEFLGDKLEKALYKPEKNERIEDVNLLKEELIYFIEGKYPGMGKTKQAKDFFEKEIEKLIHQNILKQNKRQDGRKLNETRKIRAQVGILPRTHGSGLFCRGATKALSILTLGPPGDRRLLEGMEIVGKKRFMHHYNFPPYSVGEVKPMRGPGRRDIGHGMLAEKALLCLIPGSENFPYTIRVVSEIVSSNGSSSMASVSSACLALMDAGVPIKDLATGIAIGLIMSDNGIDYKILTDIQGPEDHHGDMDLKIAGTKKGITAMQMDVKIKGITEKILKSALEQGKRTRIEILNQMEKTIAKPREKLSPFAPRIFTVQINPEKIREVIGPGGKMINEITGQCGVEIDIEDSGLIYVTSIEGEEGAEKAISWIKNITKEVKVGETYQGKVKRILAFGAFVEILPKQEGLIHISKLAPYHVNKVEDVVKIGDIVSVKVISIDEQGRINLTMENNQPQ